MHAGIPLYRYGEYEAYQFAFTELKEAGRIMKKCRNGVTELQKSAWSSAFTVVPVPGKQHLQQHCSSTF